MRKLLFCFFLGLILLIPINTQAIVSKSEKEYITDEANLLNEDAEEYIVRYSEFLDQKRNIDYYVVTIKDLDGMELGDYCTQIFQDYRLSDKGVLILISKNDRQLRVQVGEKIEKIVTPQIIDQYINTYFLPYLEREEWNDGIINGYTALYKYICDHYHLDASSMKVDEKLDFITKYKSILMILILVVAALCNRYYVSFHKKISSHHLFHLWEFLLLLLIVLINIFAISISYLFQPAFILFVLAFEFFLYYSATTNNKSQLSHRKKSSQPRKQRRKKKKKRLK